MRIAHTIGVVGAYLRSSWHKGRASHGRASHSWAHRPLQTNSTNLCLPRLSVPLPPPFRPSLYGFPIKVLPSQEDERRSCDANADREQPVWMVGVGSNSLGNIAAGETLQGILDPTPRRSLAIWQALQHAQLGPTWPTVCTPALAHRAPTLCLCPVMNSWLLTKAQHYHTHPHTQAYIEKDRLPNSETKLKDMIRKVRPCRTTTA